MDTTYRLTQKGSEVQELLNKVTPNEQAISQLDEDKVDKVAGKGLSEANFTNAEKSKLDALPTRAELTEEENLKADKSDTYTKTEVDTKLGQKQDTINDLQTIREGAAAGATAYQKPGTGIPQSAMDADVQAKLNAAGSADAAIAAEREAREAADQYLQTQINGKANSSDVTSGLALKSDKETTYTKQQVDSLLTPKQTAQQVADAIAAALASYTNTAGMNSAIATALASYYTKTQTDSLLADKQTAAQVSAAITAALASYYTKTVMDGLLAAKQNTLQFDLTPTDGSSNPVTSDGIYDAIQTAVSGLLNTQQVQALITNALASYSTTAEVSSAIATALQSYSTTAEVATLITTALNAYATKDYVSQQVQEYQGTFRGTYNTLAELEATTGNHHNDYAWVKVTDSDGDNDYDRYKYNGSTWVYEYRLNNTHFTSAELASIRSGMTEAKRQKLDALPTNADLTTALNGKQQVIQNGASIGLGLGVCTTDATTVAKVATLANFLMLPNVPVSIRFTKAINCVGATLNINSQGAKPLYIGGNALQPGVVKAGCTITVVYDGTNWNIICISGLEQSSSPSDLFVDMGLPSGLLWAKKNIDVTQSDGFAASEYQYECTFFSWGNTEGHNPVDASSFSYDWGSGNDGPYASTPGAALNGNVPASMDFARANLGAPWRLPTTDEFAELFANITYIDANGDAIAADNANKLTTVNGITGLRLKSNANNNILFFPCSGYGNGSSWYNRGSYGYYWSGSLYSSTDGRDLSFYSGGVYPQITNNRFYGFTGRAVQ